MLERRIPEWLRHAPAPSVQGFAVLAGIEAVARGILISVFPLQMYRALQDPVAVSEAYFLVGVVSMIAGLLVPGASRRIPRRWMYTLGALLYLSGTVTALAGGAAATITALGLIAIGTVTLFICFNAYVLDYIARVDLGRCETLRMFYSAAGWTAGPVAGVWLLEIWAPLPFLIAGAAMLALLAMFWFLRLGNGKLIARARAPAPNPLSFLPTFFAQPRLVAGYLFATLRSTGWWVYIVYLPIFAVESGLSPSLGGIALSISNGALFATPLLLKALQRTGIRRGVRLGFSSATLFFALGTLLAPWPWAAVAALVLGSFCLIFLDICAGLPFLMAVKPSQRTEMSAVYASYRDVSGILSPGLAWLVLLSAPVSGIFGAMAVGLIGAWGLAGRLHPRLGQARLHPAPAE